MKRKTQVGLVRKIDKINRLVIPIEYLNKLGIEKGSEVEILATDNEIIVRRYSDKEELEREIDDLICKYGIDKIKEVCNIM